MTSGIRASVVILWACCVPVVVAQAQAEVRGNTIVTSKTLEFDYKRLSAVFDTNVEVVDPMIRVKSDRLTILFDKTNDVKSVTAVGNVNLWHEGSRGVCRKAVYLVAEGELVLMGDVMLRNEDRIGTCEKATYDVRSGEVKLTGNALLKRTADSVRADDIVFQLEKGDVESVKATGNVRMEHNDTTRQAPLMPSLKPTGGVDAGR